MNTRLERFDALVGPIREIIGDAPSSAMPDEMVQENVAKLKQSAHQLLGGDAEGMAGLMLYSLILMILVEPA
jgi:hypothetical protein